MTKIALSVDVKTTPGQRDAFVARIKQHGEYCLAHEPGCLEFHVVVPIDETDRVVLFEVYADKAALDAHDSSEHMAAYRRDTASMIAARMRVTGHLA